MSKILSLFEKAIIIVLIIMMALVLLLATIDLGYVLLANILSPPVLLLDIKEILEIFGLFLLVLIGLELLETIKVYIAENIIRVQVVFMVALITIAREVIVMDIHKIQSLKMIAIGVIILSISIGYYIINKIQK